jgi:hypothetical protein
VQTFSGQRLNVREDGTVDMSADDAEYLIRDGLDQARPKGCGRRLMTHNLNFVGCSKKPLVRAAEATTRQAEIGDLSPNTTPGPGVTCLSLTTAGSISPGEGLALRVPTPSAMESVSPVPSMATRTKFARRSNTALADAGCVSICLGTSVSAFLRLGVFADLNDPTGDHDHRPARPPAPGITRGWWRQLATR